MLTYSAKSKGILRYRIIAPSRLGPICEEHNDHFLERFFHQLRLNFKDKELSKIIPLLESKPGVVIMSLERAAVISEINDACSGLIIDFNSSDAAILDVAFGKFNPFGRLPKELPSCMEAVEKQYPDLPFDSENPLYEYGAGIRYR